MGIGKRIKEARESLGLTQSQLGSLVGVTGSAITNYEKETSHPKEAVLYKLFEALHVDANYLFQDIVNISQTINDVTAVEYELIQKYRALDAAGREHVNTILRWESDRINETELSKAAVARSTNYYRNLPSGETDQIIPSTYETSDQQD